MVVIDRQVGVAPKKQWFTKSCTKSAITVLAFMLVTGEAQAQAQAPDTKAVDQLHRDLHLTPQQEGGWQLYRSAANIPEKAQARRRSASALFPTLDAPRRMDLVEAEMREELSDLQRQSQALKAFYNTLSTDQKRTFDAKTLPPAGDEQQGQNY